LKAFTSAGLSFCSQRVEVFVSGISPHTRMVADPPAVAAATAIPATTAATLIAAPLANFRFTPSSLMVSPPRGLYNEIERVR